MARRIVTFRIISVENYMYRPSHHKKEQESVEMILTILTLLFFFQGSQICGKPIFREPR